MSKYDNYIKEIAKTTFVSGLTSSMVANELGARAILKILMDKGIVTYDEWVDAIKSVTETFVSLHTNDFDDLFEPDFIDFTSTKEQIHK